MCGIGGILKQGQIDSASLEAMSKAMAHRGPDDKGLEVLSAHDHNNLLSIGLVHRRLSIIDLSDAAHQPMLDEQTGNWIVYNGEVYNFKQIRADAQAKGCKFKSNSDTEVILKAYNLYGVDCLSKLRGMFAFAIWDQKKQMLFLAVDRFGIKPLYFYRGTQNLFVFASELRAILKSGLVHRKIERTSVDSFLAYGAVQAPLTIISGVISLLPAQYMLYKPADHDIKIASYWSPSCGAADNSRRAASELREILDDSVNEHLVSDVPVGLFLSGGIDSSTTVILANKLKKSQLRTFSVTFPESSYSEGKYAGLVAERYCKNHTEIKVSEEDLLGFFPEALKAMDQPTIDGINVYTISKAVRDAGIKVVLSGQGGDEIFGGYSTFKRIPVMLKAHRLLGLLPGSMRKKTANGIDSIIKRSEIGSKYSQIIESDDDLFSQYLILRQLYSPKAREYLVGRAFNGEVLNGVPVQVVEALNDEMSELDIFSKVSLLELRLYLANMLLRDGDFMSMAHGLEVRVPLLDHKIAEFVFGVHTNQKISRELPKPLLVNAMKDLLPKEIYMRTKMGFTFPWEIWLRGRLRSRLEALINEFPDDNELGLNMAHCRKILQMFLLKAPGVSWARVWAIYVLLRWYNENIYSG